MVLALTIIGRELFSYRGRFVKDEDGYIAIAPDPREGKPVAVHFEDFGSALSVVFFIFYNEEWHVSMYWIARTF